MTRQYFVDNSGRNLSWCRPYKLAKGDKQLIVAVNEGEIVGVSQGAEADALQTIADTFDVPMLDRFGDLFNYNDYNSIDYSELGCSSCPWFKTCKAMDEDE
jgi:hypothetical protein